MFIYKVTILTNNIEKTNRFAVTEADKILELVNKFITTQYKGNGQVLKIEKEDLYANRI